MTTINTTDSRFRKAVALSDQSARWLKLRDKLSGKCRAVGIPSSRDANRFYVVTRQSCDCEDRRRHPIQPCKHIAALEIVLARKAEIPARVTVEGLRQMARERNSKRYTEIFGGNS